MYVLAFRLLHALTLVLSFKFQTMMDHFVWREQLQHIPTNNGDIMSANNGDIILSVPHFHVRSVGINDSSGGIEPISLRPTQTLPKVSKTVEGLEAESCSNLGC